MFAKIPRQAQKRDRDAALPRQFQCNLSGLTPASIVPQNQFEPAADLQSSEFLIKRRQRAGGVKERNDDAEMRTGFIHFFARWQRETSQRAMIHNGWRL